MKKEVYSRQLKVESKELPKLIAVAESVVALIGWQALWVEVLRASLSDALRMTVLGRLAVVT